MLKAIRVYLGLGMTKAKEFLNKFRFLNEEDGTASQLGTVPNIAQGIVTPESFEQDNEFFNRHGYSIINKISNRVLKLSLKHLDKGPIKTKDGGMLSIYRKNGKPYGRIGTKYDELSVDEVLYRLKGGKVPASLLRHKR